MSLLCIGANHGGVDVSTNFIYLQKVWIGWGNEEASDLIKILKRAPVGTMIAIKSWQPTVGLRIKAVGFIKDDAWSPLSPGSEYFCRNVKWLTRELHNFERIHDKMENMRNGSLYYEHNERLVADILSLVP